MGKYDIYRQIAERTQGDIYVGVVGPVRTGKSTFIKRFMDLLVVPNIQNEYAKRRANDELPQSGTGRTIMTTEPKFIPNEAATITVDENVRLKVRLVDCVGYLVKGAIGHMENNIPRMVSTPWFEHQVPFVEAAEIGTKKVINEHSTIGLVITTDGSVTEIPREEYIAAEERVINELKDINKPFVIVLNTANPLDENVLRLREELEIKYATPVLASNCAELTMESISSILERILLEFPIYEIGFNVPRWFESLDNNHPLRCDMINAIRNSFKNASKIREIKDCIEKMGKNEFVKKIFTDRINLGDGRAFVDITVKDDLFYRTLSELTGIEIEGEHRLIGLMKELSVIKREYEKIEFALHEVKVKGYGIVVPKLEELSLEEPEIVKHGNRFGVKLRASAPSIHFESIKQKCKMYKGRYKVYQGISACLQYRNIFKNCVA